MTLSQAVAPFLHIIARNVYFAGLDVELIEGRSPPWNSTERDRGKTAIHSSWVTIPAT